MMSRLTAMHAQKPTTPPPFDLIVETHTIEEAPPAWYRWCWRVAFVVALAGMVQLWIAGGSPHHAADGRYFVIMKPPAVEVEFWVYCVSWSAMCSLAVAAIIAGVAGLAYLLRE